MKHRRSCVLITGFGPFPGVPINVSGRLARHLALHARRTLPGADFVAAELPTVWREAPLLLDQLYLAHRPQVALHFGVSHQAHAMTVECFARNIAGRPDASGANPAWHLLTPDGPPEHAVTLPTARLVARMHRRAVPAVLSHDAGNYLCNAILYHSLELMRALDIGGRAGFIHLPTRLPPQPATKSRGPAPSLYFEDAIHGGLEVLATLLARPSPPANVNSRQPAFPRPVRTSTTTPAA